MDDGVRVPEHAHLEHVRAVPAQRVLERDVWAQLPGDPRAGRRPHRAPVRAAVPPVLRDRIKWVVQYWLGICSVKLEVVVHTVCVWGDELMNKFCMNGKHARTDTRMIL